MEPKNEAFMSTVKVGPKGQIVIPKEIRDMFAISPGDSLIIMATADRGIALQRQEVMEQIANAIFAGRGEEIYPREEQAHLPKFAEAIKDVTEKEDDNEST